MMALALRFAPYIVAGFLAMAVWGLWERGKNLKAQRDEARAVAHAYERVVASEKARQKELEKLRAEYEERERALRAIPDDGCLDRTIPDALGVLLKSDTPAGDSGAGAKGGADDAR